MAFDVTKPADNQFISAGPGDIRENMRALKEDKIVNAQKVMDYSPGNASGNIPISNGSANANLNADMLDGNHASAFATAGHSHAVATTSSNGLMSNTDKSKLDGVSAGAEVNQNAFANIVVGTTTIQADAESDTLTFVAGQNIALTPDATNDKVTVAFTGTLPIANGGTGATTTAAALANIGITATAAELNALDGITATVTELNFTDGVTSNIQTQLNGKAPTSHAASATTYGISTASVYGHAKATSAAPIVAGTAAVGTDNALYARGDHVHPAQTSVSGNAGTATKLQTARNINGVPFDGTGDITVSAGSPGVTNYINSGLKFGTPSGLNLPIESGEASIDGTTVSYGGGTLALTARKAAMPYLTSAGAIGKVEAAYPTAYIDNNTVGFWIFNQAAGVAVPNSAVGVSSIAVANNLVPSGTFTRVDGRCDYAIKGDGSTGYFTSANYTGFPIGAAEREINMLLTVNSISAAIQQLWGYGADSTNNVCAMSLRAGGVFYGNFGASNDPSTAYTVDNEKPYLVTFQYDGAQWCLLVNGLKVFSEARALNTTATVLKLLAFFASGYYANQTVHFFELRNKCRTQQQIAEIAAKLLIPVCWDSDDYLTQDGTAIGTLTAVGGLSASFTGSNYKAYTSASQSPSTGGTGNIGMSWTTAKYFESVKVYGTSDYGIDSTNSASNITLELQGSNDGTTWVPIDSVTVSDYPGVMVSLQNKTKASYLKWRVTFVSTSTGTLICISRILFITNTSRKSLKSLLPTDSISLGYAYTSSSAIQEMNDSDWAYGRREGAVNGNRIVTQTYKYVVADSPLNMTWQPPFGVGAKYKVDWLSAEDSNGMNEASAASFFVNGSEYGVCTVPYKSGKIGAAVGGGGSVCINYVWRTGGFLRPIFTLLEDDTV